MLHQGSKVDHNHPLSSYPISVIALTVAVSFVFFEGAPPWGYGEAGSHARFVSLPSERFDIARLSLLFEENRGQAPGAVRFFARGPGYAVLSESDRIVWRNRTGLSGAVDGFSMRWIGGKAAEAIAGIDLQGSESHYFIGNKEERWQQCVVHYRAVRLDGIYPGIDLLLYGSPAELEFDFVVAPGADPEIVKLGFDGITSMRAAGNGGYILKTKAETYLLNEPVLYQEIGGERVSVEGAFRRYRGQTLGFFVGDYDRGFPLVIDPVVSASGSYLGGSLSDVVTSLDRDEEGYLYVAGATRSADFISNPISAASGGGIVDGYIDLYGPTGRTINGANRIWNYGSDAFVMKLSRDATELIWATYLGGSYSESPPRNGGDAAFDMVVDGSGNVLVTGATSSGDFPGTTEGMPARGSAFVAKLGENGSLTWGKYLGAGTTSWGIFDATNYAYGVATDASDNVYVTGTTGASDFPTTPGAFQGCGFEEDDLYCDGITSCGETNSSEIECEGTDAFVVKLDPEGKAVYSTILTSTDHEWVDGVQQPGDERAFGHEYGAAIKVDAEGRAYVVGTTTGAGSDFSAYGNYPTHSEAYRNGIDKEYGGRPGVFVSILSDDGSALEYSTLLGGSGVEEGLDIALDTEGNVYVTGYTTSEDFPTKGPAANGIAQGMCRAWESGSAKRCGDAFITKFNPTLSDVHFSRYLGGEGQEYLESGATDFGEDGATAIDLDSDGNVLVAGYTSSDSFPTKDASQDTLGGQKDGFAAKLDGENGETIYATYLGSTGDEFVWDVLGFDAPDEGSEKTGDWEHELVVDLIAGESTSAETIFFSQLENAFDDLVEKVGGWLVGLSFTTPYRMIPGGIGYDSFNYDPDVGAFQSTFSTLRILGTGLIDVEEVVFENGGAADVQMVTEIVSVSDIEVVYDLIVEHGAPLGEREIILKQKNGKPDINVTDNAGKNFLVTKVAVSFNQAVDDRSLDTEEYHRMQIAGKHGAMRIQFHNDPDRDETYRGELRLNGVTGRSSSVQDYRADETHTVNEMLGGGDYLSIPYPGDGGFPAGTYTFSCDMYAPEWHLRCPDIERTFVDTRSLLLPLIIFDQPLPGGGTRSVLPAGRTPEDLADSVRAFLAKTLPIAGDNLQIETVLRTALPADVQAEIDPSTLRLSKRGKLMHEEDLLEMLDVINLIAATSGDDVANVIVSFVPRSLISSLGYTRGGSCFVVISDDFRWAGPTVAHELGHKLGECVLKSRPSLNLGDEYNGGWFNCAVNPPAYPVPGKDETWDYVLNEPYLSNTAYCPDSPILLDVHGDNTGVFTSRSAYDAVEDEPRFYWSGTPGRRSYSYMAMGLGAEGGTYWVSSKTYDATHRMLLADPAASKQKSSQSVAMFEIKGWVGRDKTGEIVRVAEQEITGTRTPDIGPYEARLLNAGGSVIQSKSFSVSFLEKSDEPELADHAYFNTRLPRESGASAVSIVLGEIEIARQNLSPNAPDVRIKSPISGQNTSGLIDAVWEGSDADGDSLVYNVVFYADEDSAGVPVAVRLRGTRHRIDLRNLQAGSRPAIGVVASDGYNRTETRVYLNGSSAPRINGLTPTSIQQGATGVSLHLTGSGFVDGTTLAVGGGGVTVTGIDVASSSEISATLNVASDAPTGIRIVQVFNPDASSAEAALLEVKSSGLMDVQLTWQPPDSSIANGPPRGLEATIVSSTYVQLDTGAGKTLTARKSRPSFPLIGAATVVDEVEPNDLATSAQVLYGPSPAQVKGQAEDVDEGGIIFEIEYGESIVEDDIEDFFEVTTTAPGISVRLDSFNVDCDLYVLDKQTLDPVDFALTGSDAGPEIVELPDEPAGAYLIGVSIFDSGGTGNDSTRYVLTVTGSLSEEGGGDGPVSGPTHYRIYRSNREDAVSSGTRIAEVEADAGQSSTASYLDKNLTRGTWYYSVKAVYTEAISMPSNEVLVEPPGTEDNQAPRLQDSPPDMTLLVDADPYEEDLRRIFSDPDGHDLNYSANSSDQAVAAVQIDGYSLRVIPLSVGTAEITMRANDGLGGSAVAVFRVLVPTGVAAGDTQPALTTGLHPNYPNPFEFQTTIRYELDSTAEVSLEIFSLLGRRVATLVDETKKPGRYQIQWNGVNAAGGRLPAGVYLCRLRAGHVVQTQTLVLIR